MKLSDYFEVVKPEYIYIRLIPMRSIRNYNSDSIIMSVASIYRTFLQSIVRYNKKYFFSVKCKVSYMVYVEQSKAEFYFIIPKAYLTLFKDKIGNTWNGITTEFVPELPHFDKGAVWGMSYRKEDALSLTADRRDNVLLSSILSTMDVMQDGDRIAVLYNFIPSDQVPWRAYYDKIMDKLKEGAPIEKDKTGAVYAVKLAMQLTIVLYDLILSVINEFFQTSQPKKETYLINVSPETKKKRDTKIVETQIAVISHSADWQRQSNNGISVCEAFKSLTSDNELMYHRAKSLPSYAKLRYEGVESMKMTAVECQNLVSLPGRELIDAHKLECIDVLETEVPKELQQGNVCIGTNTCKGNTQKAYLTTDKNLSNLTLCVIGPNRSGKTTLLGNLSNDMIRAGECVIIPDFCGNCELSDDVSKSIKGNVLTIDCSDFTKLQGLGYNEVDQTVFDTFTRYRNAKMMTIQLITLVDAIMDDNNDMSCRMDHYLESAALVCFMSGGSIQDVFSTLTNYRFRRKMIDKLPADQLENLSEYIAALNDLDDEKKNEEPTTKLHLVRSILDRVSRLKQNTYMELMLKKDCKNNFNLVEEIQKPQLICLKMPESMFSTSAEKSVYATYWTTKIWLALQLRKSNPKINPIKVNILYDELYQVPSCQEFIRSKLSQTPKFAARYIITAHYLNQIPIIRNELRAASTSYILLCGSDKDNYKELREELQPYSVEDLLAIKRYHALCLIRYEQGYAKFVVKLPPPLK